MVTDGENETYILFSCTVELLSSYISSLPGLLSNSWLSSFPARDSFHTVELLSSYFSALPGLLSKSC